MSEPLTHERHQTLQGQIHLLIVALIVLEGACAALGWSLARAAIVARLIVLLICATWHFVGWLEHRDEAKRHPDLS